MCNICKDQHPTGLHGYQLKNRTDDKKNDNRSNPSVENKDNAKTGDSAALGSVDRKKVSVASTALNTDITSMYVVPVKVKYKNSDFVHNTFAMLTAVRVVL